MEIQPLRKRTEETEISPISSAAPDLFYLGLLAYISYMYLGVGFLAVRATGISNSVPPLVMALFRYCCYLFTYHSVSRGYFMIASSMLAVTRNLPAPPASPDFFHLLLFLLSCSYLETRHFFSVGVYILVIPLYLIYHRRFLMRLLRPVLDSSSLHPFTTWLQIYMSAHQKTDFLLPSSTNAAATGQESKGRKIVKAIKFAVGMTGSILFQNYFKLNSFEQTLTILYLAVAWLASTALLSVSDDLGVFNFILGNVVGSTVAEAGLGAHTWLAFAASLVLYGLRLELTSILSPHGRCILVRVHVTILILVTILSYGAYLVLFVYRSHILSG